MTDSTKTTQQSQSSQTSPWSQAMPLVNNLLGQYGSADSSVTGAQSAALGNLSSAASAIPNFGSAGSQAIGNLFNTDNSGQVGMLNTAYDTLKTNLGGTASGANLNPYDTPGFGDALKTTMDDITNRTKGVYAAAGRDPSGAGSFAGSLGRGLTQGVSPLIQSQYNTNYGNMNDANKTLFSGAGTTAGGVNALNQQQLTNGVAGLSGASALPGLYTAPATAQLGAANAGYGQQFQNWAQLLQPSVALAGLGSTSSGTGTSTQTSTPSLMDSIKAGMGLAGTGASAAGAAASAWPMLLALSDRRTKYDIAPVGKLNDGQNVYSFKYRGSDKPQIGLMAQEVMHHAPEAVHDIGGGVLAVDYGAATRRARVGQLEAA